MPALKKTFSEQLHEEYVEYLRRRSAQGYALNKEEQEVLREQARAGD